MAEHVDTSGPGTYDRFLALFRDSVIGIVGIGTVTHDEQDQAVTGSGFAAGRTTHGDGKPRILAFADPDAASQAPGSQCNAGISGRVLLQMAAADPDCMGVLVNSATHPISLVISKATAESLVGAAATTPRRKPWWKPR